MKEFTYEPGGLHNICGVVAHGAHTLVGLGAPQALRGAASAIAMRTAATAAATCSKGGGAGRGGWYATTVAIVGVVCAAAGATDHCGAAVVGGGEGLLLVGVHEGVVDLFILSQRALALRTSTEQRPRWRR